MSDRIVTCVYCGHEYPNGTPTSQNELLTAHIAACEKHPMKAIKEQLDSATARADDAEFRADVLRNERDDASIERDTLKRERDAALTVLRGVQWSSNRRWCPSCMNHANEGHASSCALAACLNGCAE